MNSAERNDKFNSNFVKNSSIRNNHKFKKIKNQ